MLCTFWAQEFLNTRRKLPLISDERQFQISLSPLSLAWSSAGLAMAGDRALFSVIGVLFIRSGTADGEAIGDNLSNSVRGSHGRVKARPGVSVSQGLLHPGSLLRLTDLTSFAAAQTPVHAPDERLSRVSNEQYKRRKSGFLCHTSSLISL